MNRVPSSGDARRPFARAAFRPVPQPEPLEPRLLLATFTVTTTADAGPGSLRQAILDANAAEGADVIRFAIPGDGVHTVAPLSPLPADGGGLTIDGTTQAGYRNSPLIQLDGAAALPFADGLTLGENSTVKALAIGRFGGAGVSLQGPRGTVTACYIGTDATGEFPAPNSGDGITFVAAPSTTTPGATITGNVISANGGSGVRLMNVSSTLTGNIIGLDAGATRRLSNGGDGVQLIGGHGVITPVRDSPVVLGPNVISGNGGHGVHVVGGSLLLRGSAIGTDAGGNNAVGNGGHGVFLEGANGIIGGSARGQSSTVGNLISANRGHGVYVMNVSGGSAAFPTLEVRGNKIGTDATGDDANPTLGNGGHGVAMVNVSNAVIGGDGDAAPNMIAFNGGSGVLVRGPDPSASSSPTNVLVRRNSIFSNARLGIDLDAPAGGDSGVTPNDPRDADRGPNALLNFPEIVSARVRDGVGTVVAFRTDVPRTGTYRVEFFASPAADPTGFGEGRTYLGEATVSGTAQVSPPAAVLPAVPVGTDITATVSDVGGRFTSEFSRAVAVTPLPQPRMVGRYVSSAGIVTGKAALLPGGTGTLANVVTRLQGITGVVLDIDGLFLPDARAADSFSFLVSAADGSSGWFNYAARKSFSIDRGGGAGGSDRVTVTFLDNPVRNRWLQVTLKANVDTGLTAPDLFYFGALPGDAGDPGSPLRVTALDLAAVRRALNAAVPPGGSPLDFDRNGVINATDLAIVRQNLGRRLLPLVEPAGLTP